MKYLTLKMFCAVGSFALLTGCSDTTSDAVAGVTPSSPAVYGITPTNQVAPDFQGMTSEQREKFTSDLFDAQTAISEGSRLETWEEANIEVRRALQVALESDANLPAYQIETLAATYMLDRALQSGRASEAPVSDIGFYTDLLIKNESPNAQLVASSLDVLDETWPAEKVVYSASRTIEATERYAETVANRSGENRAERLRNRGDLQAGRGAARVEQSEAAVRHLTALSDPSILDD